MSFNKEEFFISQFSDTLIGDDGAVVFHKKGNWVYTTDSFFEDVHFKLSWMSLSEIASKAMLVNISDAIVMNAKPKYALLNVAIPSNFDKISLKNLSDGFKKSADDFNIRIIGGDTISNDKLQISITLISKTKNPIYRHGLKIGDILYYTGDIGTVKKDLNKLLQNKAIPKDSKFIKPILKQKFFRKISKYVSSAIDISDGVAFELERLSKINGVGFRFITKFTDDMLCSGEEYEILFAINPAYQEKVQQIANSLNVKLNFCAIAVDGEFRHNCQEHHFKAV
ncbi:MAG: thiamine-phosphate kinase [Campylobacteraceae bacterium 4484_166]|nr:MAG: thiamine-phosphate kinase [Campylobacteraceae bacterium 4484_166]